MSISSTRQSGMGTNPITFAEIESWSRLNGVSLNPWEVDMIVAMDNTATKTMLANSKR